MAILKQTYPRTTSLEAYYVKHPVLNKNGKWVAANVHLPQGYTIPPLSIPFDTEEECQIACDTHNLYHGWTTKESLQIIAKSMGLL